MSRDGIGKRGEGRGGEEAGMETETLPMYN